MWTYVSMYIHPSTCLGASQVALVVKTLPADAGDLRDSGSIPGSGRSPGEGHGNPLQYSCLENPHGLAGYSPQDRKESDTTEQLNWIFDNGAKNTQWKTENLFNKCWWAKRMENESEVSQSCLPLCNPMDCSLLGSSVHAISRQEYWSELLFPSPGDLPDPGIEPGSPSL